MINVQVFLSDMSIRLEGWDFQWLEEGSHLPLPLPEPTRGNIFHAEVAAFLEAVSKGSPDPILCDFTDAVQTQCVVDALKRSIFSGHIEQVAEVTALL
jgi:predicted dehydrogenase